MSYIAQADLVGLVPDDLIAGATDDTGESGNAAAVWASVAESVDQDINGRLSARYSVPIASPPPTVLAAAKAIAACFLYKRRGYEDKVNPWAILAKHWQDKLDRIGSGQEPLTYDAADALSPVLTITEPARTHSAAGNLMV